MKKLLMLLFLVSFPLFSFAQKGKNQFALFAGYEYFPEQWDGKGYNIGLEFKRYVSKRFYAATVFHAGINNGSHINNYESNNVTHSFYLHNSVRNYMLGFGPGFDILHLDKHQVYIQAAVGLASSEQKKDGVEISPDNRHTIKTFEEKILRFGLSTSVGYDYAITDWLTLGANYTGWYIGYDFNSSINGKISFIF